MQNQLCPSSRKSVTHAVEIWSNKRPDHLLSSHASPFSLDVFCSTTWQNELWKRAAQSKHDTACWRAAGDSQRHPGSEPNPQSDTSRRPWAPRRPLPAGLFSLHSKGVGVEGGFLLQIFTEPRHQNFNFRSLQAAYKPNRARRKHEEIRLSGLADCTQSWCLPPLICWARLHWLTDWLFYK